jgi:tripartite-type tricarboxylate transporter receptor subunit TctC
MPKQLLMAAIATVALLSTASAQTYPSRSITFVVPSAAGGPADVLARTLAERMRAPLGRSIIVENVVGAGGSVGVRRVAYAAPDGYTVSVGNWSTHVVNGAIYALGYDLLNDLDPVVVLPSSPQLIVTKNALPAKSTSELIAWLQQNKASAGTAGIGSASHIGGLLFQNITDTRFAFVPYRGTGPAMQDLIGGQIDLMLDQPPNSLPHVRDGQIKAFAVTSKERLAAAPDIPTVDEAGLAGLYVSVWYGLWAPKGTPKEIIATLQAAVSDALADPGLRKRFADLGQEVPQRESQTSAALAPLQKAEIEKWWPIIKAANIKGE